MEEKTTMTLYDREWQYRGPVLEAALDILSDFKKRTAREMSAMMPRSRLDYSTPKLVKSVLDEEGHRYIRKTGISYAAKEWSFDPEFTLFEREWQIRRVILEKALNLLRDGQPRMAKQIVKELHRRHTNKQPSKIDKSMVNSVLFSEGRRCAKYNKIYSEHRIVP